MSFDYATATEAEIVAEAERRKRARANGTLDQMPDGWRGTPERAKELGLTKQGQRRSTAEHDSQVDVFKWIDGDGAAEWPELLLAFAVPNGGHRKKAVAGKLKAEGVRAGQLDIVVPIPRGGYGGLYVEMKTPTGRVAPLQSHRANLLAAVGNMIAVCRSEADAIEEIKRYMRQARSYKARPRESIARAADTLREAIAARA